jgi:vanillate O-demethylase monooxygenase subunit
MLKTGIAPAGEPRERGVAAHVIHAMTPETSGSSHYFYSAWRNYRSEDAEYTQAMEQAVRYGFEVEDKPMIEAQQEALAGKEFMSSKPSLLGIDTASVKARRLYDRVLAAEASSKGMLSHTGS